MIDPNQTILLVEDDKNDIFFLQHAFKSAGIIHPMHVVADGQQAIDYLAGAGKFADRHRFPFPRLVLLDLKLPVKMGSEVLRWIQQNPDLGSLLVIVLTSSSDPADVDESFRLGARSYLCKPLTIEGRLEMARLIKRYWLELNECPSVRPRKTQKSGGRAKAS